MAAPPGLLPATHVVLLCTAPLVDGSELWFPHHNISHWPLHGPLAETPSLPHVAWVVEGRKTPETFHSFMPPKLVPCGKYLKTRRPALIPFVHSSSSVTLLSRNKLEVYLGEVLLWPTVLLFQFRADLFF